MGWGACGPDRRIRMGEAQKPLMSTPKEPYFFSDDPQYAKGLDWYTSLFDDAADRDICGESSTHYTKLPTYPQTIKRMRQHAPNIKLIYVIVTSL